RQDFAQSATSRMLDRGPRPTGMVLGGAELAVGALAAIRGAHLRLPEDLSFVGYGDPEWFRLWAPPITTVRLPVEELASTIATLLFRLMDPEESPAPDEDMTPVRVVVEPRLIVRGTTAASR
ncbi:MAG TPA: substrate-binding domain-containing protein, partial [Chloroflexota bacterium]